MRRAVKYPVLKGAMAACGISAGMLARRLKKSPSTVFAKLSGRVAFDLSEAIDIRNAFFAEISLDELFAEQNRQKGASPEQISEVCRHVF